MTTTSANQPWTYETLAQCNPAQLENILLTGSAPDPEPRLVELTGHGELIRFWCQERFLQEERRKFRL